MSTLRIRGFLPNTLIDWPGRLAAEVFLEGCNLRCPYCHAGYLLSSAPEAETFELEHVLAHLKEEAGWLDGVVVSGGEPTIQPELPGLLRAFKEAGFAVKVDTNGTQPEMLATVLRAKLVDCVAMDVKAPLDERYARAAGRPDVNLRAIRRSLALLREWAGDYELRTTVCPSVLSPENVLELAVDLMGAPHLVLQPFKPGHCLDPELNAVAPYPEELLLQLAERCQEFVETVTVRGREPVPARPKV